MREKKIWEHPSFHITVTETKLPEGMTEEMLARGLRLIEAHEAGEIDDSDFLMDLFELFTTQPPAHP